MTEPTDEGAQVVEPGLSILGQLKSRRAEIAEADHLDLRVPRWDRPEIFIRYGHVSHDKIRRGITALENAPAKRKTEAEINSNIDVLIYACKAVIARVDGQDYSLREGDPKGEFTRFDGDLAANLGLADGWTARDIVRALFIADGDIFSHAQAVSEFSGYRETVADEEVLGE